MKKKTFTGKLVRYERRNNSYYGNPKYFGVFEDAEGNILCATTATDASCGRFTSAYSLFRNKRFLLLLLFHNLIFNKISVNVAYSP